MEHEKLETIEQNMQTIELALENIREAIEGFNLTNNPQDIKTTIFEKLSKELTELRQNSRRVRYAEYGVSLQDMENALNALKVKSQDVDDFEKGKSNNIKILTYYYYKMVEIYGTKYMEKITNLFIMFLRF